MKTQMTSCIQTFASIATEEVGSPGRHLVLVDGLAYCEPTWASSDETTGAHVGQGCLVPCHSKQAAWDSDRALVSLLVDVSQGSLDHLDLAALNPDSAG